MTFAHIPIEKIHVHDKNVRFTAVADEGMVASIRSLGILDPIMVAPHPSIAGDYMTIDGHRRLDGARQAELTQVPANIRKDLATEAQQVEVMIATAVHREDLTPVEEAAAYEQLELFGLTPQDMAASTGRPLSTIKARLKLRVLPESTKTKLHEGQLTLGDAEAILEFADQPDVLAKLEKAVGAGNLRYEIAQAKQTRDMHRRRAEIAKDICGGYSLERIEMEGTYPNWDTEKGPCAVEKTGLPDPASHLECGRIYWPPSLWQNPFLVCTNPGRHPKPKNAPDAADRAAAERDAQWEADRAAREQEQLRQAAAAKVRLAHLMNHFKAALTVKTTPKPIVVALPHLLCDSLDRGETDFASYAVALGLEVDPRGFYVHGSTEHRREIRAMKPAQLLKAYAALLAAQMESLLSWADSEESAAVWDWMIATGYELSDVDEELLANARGASEAGAA